MELIMMNKNDDSNNFDKVCMHLRNTIIEENLEKNGGILTSKRTIFNSDYLALAVETENEIREIIGFVATRNKDGCVYINQAAIKKEYRKKGIAKTLISSIIKEHEDSDITADVRFHNAPSIALFKSLGFMPNGQTERSYCFIHPSNLSKKR